MTLVELVVCMSIMILISTLCYARINDTNIQINSFTKQLCADIRYVRRCNMLGDLNTYIYYSEEDKIIRYILRSNSKDVKEVKLPNETKLVGLGKIDFKLDGTPSKQGQTIKIYNESVLKEITIVPISGRVLLKEGKYET